MDGDVVTDVAGSPFPVNVRSAITSDVSKLRVNGPGIKHGLLSTFCSYFSIDTSEAGFGQLNITVRGPKGTFTGRQVLLRFSSVHVHYYCYYCCFFIL